MGKAARTIISVVAMIAIPYIAAPIAAAVGISAAVGSALGVGATAASTIGAGLVGAGLGAGTAALTGGNPLTGALMGGLGGGIGGYTGAGSSLLGGSSGAAGAPMNITPGLGGSAVGAPMPTGGEFLSGGAATSPVGLSTAAASTGTGLSVSGGAGAGIGGGAGGFFDGVMSGLTKNLSNLAPLAMTMFNKAPQDLTQAEAAAVQERAGIAADNKNSYDVRMAEARSIVNASPNPEKAYSDTQMQVQRASNEAQRSQSPAMREATQRRYAIEGSRIGTAAVAQNADQALRTKATGLGLMPTSAPEGQAGMTLPIYEGLERRKVAANQDMARAAGGLFAGIYR